MDHAPQPRKRLKRDDTASMTGFTKSTVSAQTPVEQEQSQQSPLLRLPLELQNEIFGYIFTPWTMALLEWSRPHTAIVLLSFGELYHVGDRYISGPPGAALLRVCQAIHKVVRGRYGSGYTGVLELGGCALRSVTGDLDIPPTLLKFSHQITTISIHFPQFSTKSLKNLRGCYHNLPTLFQNLQRIELTVDTEVCDPFLEVGGDWDGFLDGNYDTSYQLLVLGEICEVLGDEVYSFKPNRQSYAFWDREGAMVEVKLLDTDNEDNSYDAGCQVQLFKYGNMKTVARHVVAGDSTVCWYWEEGMQEDDVVPMEINDMYDNIPAKHRWVIVRRENPQRRQTRILAAIGEIRAHMNVFGD